MGGRARGRGRRQKVTNRRGTQDFLKMGRWVGNLGVFPCCWERANKKGEADVLGVGRREGGLLE